MIPAKIILAFYVDRELHEQLTQLSRALGLPRTSTCRYLLAGVLRNREQIEAWKDAVLGPRFTFVAEGDNNTRGD